LNRALYCCSEEERDQDQSAGTYDIPGFGSMVYCGLQGNYEKFCRVTVKISFHSNFSVFLGYLSLLSDIRPNNDLGHPMCGNLRQGNWMIGEFRIFSLDSLLGYSVVTSLLCSRLHLATLEERSRHS